MSKNNEPKFAIEYKKIKEIFDTELQNFGHAEKLLEEFQEKGVFNILYDILHEICLKEYRKSTVSIFYF